MPPDCLPLLEGGFSEYEVLEAINVGQCTSYKATLAYLQRMSSHKMNASEKALMASHLSAQEKRRPAGSPKGGIINSRGGLVSPPTSNRVARVSPAAGAGPAGPTGRTKRPPQSPVGADATVQMQQMQQQQQLMQQQLLFQQQMMTRQMSGATGQAPPPPQLQPQPGYGPAPRGRPGVSARRMPRQQPMGNQGQRPAIQYPQSYNANQVPGRQAMQYAQSYNVVQGAGLQSLPPYPAGPPGGYGYSTPPQRAGSERSPSMYMDNNVSDIDSISSYNSNGSSVGGPSPGSGGRGVSFSGSSAKPVVVLTEAQSTIYYKVRKAWPKLTKKNCIEICKRFDTVAEYDQYVVDSIAGENASTGSGKVSMRSSPANGEPLSEAQRIIYTRIRKNNPTLSATDIRDLACTFLSLEEYEQFYNTGDRNQAAT